MSLDVARVALGRRRDVKMNGPMFATVWLVLALGARVPRIVFDSKHHDVLPIDDQWFLELVPEAPKRLEVVDVRTRARRLVAKLNPAGTHRLDSVSQDGRWALVVEQVPVGERNVRWTLMQVSLASGRIRKSAYEEALELVPSAMPHSWFTLVRDGRNRYRHSLWIDPAFPKPRKGVWGVPQHSAFVPSRPFVDRRGRIATLDNWTGSGPTMPRVDAVYYSRWAGRGQPQRRSVSLPSDSHLWGDVHFAFHPDGDRAAFVIKRFREPGIDPDRPYESQQIERKTAQEVKENVEFWNSVVQRVPSEVWIGDFATGTARQIWLVNRMPFRRIDLDGSERDAGDVNWLAWSRDGRSVLWRQGTSFLQSRVDALVD